MQWSSPQAICPLASRGPLGTPGEIFDCHSLETYLGSQLLIQWGDLVKDAMTSRVVLRERNV